MTIPADLYDPALEEEDLSRNRAKAIRESSDRYHNIFDNTGEAQIYKARLRRMLKIMLTTMTGDSNGEVIYNSYSNAHAYSTIGNGGGPVIAFGAATNAVAGDNNLLADRYIQLGLGFYYHELGHIRYTFGLRNITDSLSAGHEYSAFNMLEDPRIENMMISRHGYTKGFLTEVVSTFLTATQDEVNARKSGLTDDRADLINAFLICSRSYLPDEIKKESYESLTTENKQYLIGGLRLFGQWTALVQGNYSRAQAVQIVRDFANLFYDIRQDPTEGSHSSCGGSMSVSAGGDGRSGKSTSGNGERLTPQEVKAAQDAIQGLVDDIVADMNNPDKAQGVRSNNNQSRGTISANDKIAKIKEMLDSAVDGDANYNAEIDSIRSQIKDIDIEESDVIGRSELQSHTWPIKLNKIRDFQEILTPVVGDSDPSYIPESTSGRLNIGRLVNPEPDYGRLYDLWTENTERNTEFHMNFLLDVSSSMGVSAYSNGYNVTNLMDDVYPLMYSIDTAGGGATCSAVTFDQGAGYMKSAHESFDNMNAPYLKTKGTTNISSVLGVVKMQSKQMVNKGKRVFNIVFTDGGWDNTGPFINEYLPAMEELGVETYIYGQFSDELRKRFIALGLGKYMNNVNESFYDFLKGKLENAMIVSN